ncbi:MAG TPA: PKD domain-containing protein [Methanoregulaceae archaeon]|nr:PKD domain-containing protein [Methanoregulaceae archaeon]
MAKNPLVYCIFGIIALAAFLSPPVAAAIVEGFVFGDEDGDGRYDPATDPLLPGWNVTLAHAGNGTVIATVQTNGTGWYTFPGLDAGVPYRVTAEVRTGWTPTTPATVETGCPCVYPPPLTFHVSNDIDLYTLFPDDGLSFTTQTSIGSTTYPTVYEIEITTPGLVVRDQEQYVWENGRVYGFNVTYTGSAGTDTVYFTILNGTSATTLVYGPGTLQRPVTTFAIRTRGANISGTSRMDVWNLTFTPAGGVPYTLPGSANPGDPNTSWADQSVGRGIDVLFVRIGTLAGEYELTGKGFTLTGEQRMSWTGALPTRANLAGSIKFGSTPCPVEERAEVSFGNRQQKGRISGYITEAVSGDPLAGWTLTLTSVDGGITATAVTHADGFFSINDLPWDTYHLTETVLPGYTPENPASGDALVVINGTDLAVTQDFANSRQPGSITGTMFNDYNGDGIRGINDNPLSGWVVTLRYQNGTVSSTKTTGADGSYRFDDLTWGTYTLSETLKSGWKPTAPVGKTYVVEIDGASRSSNGRDFGNQVIPACCSCPVKAYFSSRQVSPESAHTIRFTDKSTGYVTDWSWNFGDGTTSVQRNPEHQYRKKGTYTVKQYAQTIKCDGKRVWVSSTTKVTVK